MHIWPIAAPLAAAALLLAAIALPDSVAVTLLCIPALIGAVLAAVHHAEVVAHRVGEPFGTLVLAIAVTVIEVALIVSVMLSGGPEKAALPRDTIFSAIMIIFLPPTNVADEGTHAQAPSNRQAWISFAVLLVALVSVVGLAKVLSPSIERAVAAAGAPDAVIGVAIALLVLLPETWAAVRAARANRLQTSLNLALGSALASIGLTIPAVALASVVLGLPLVLGLAPKELVLLALTFVVGAITLVSGRTHMMQGAVHLVIFAAFLFLALVP
jgi:Ca2+/H+ antiporter